MTARWLALALLAAMLATIGAFLLWAVIRPPAPVTSGSESAGSAPVAGEKRIAGAA